ncbi:M protein, serotype 12-like [Ruditapes philippinarum]|uniref:M protein, serotype 12-like n=1 Tax=Ruditapes philippinarum TaxID=129788 RepID=UPI00295B9DF4|nr:M protein, serotype 12-like [Ruditapes philippinarum]
MAIARKMEEKDSELPFVQSNKIARLENEIQELKAKITTSEKNEYEMKKQLINAEKGNKNGSEYDQSGIVKHRKEIDELKNTIVEKDKELQKAKEINLNQSVQFEKLTKEIAIIKDDITRKHDENMEARETNERKQDQRLEELLEQVKITQSMLSDILKQNSKKVQGQNQGIGSQQNKPKTSKSSVQSQPSKSEQKIETEV